MAPNRILIGSLTIQEYLSSGVLDFYDALRNLQTDPTPDGKTKTSILMAPTVMYYYDDGKVKISYGLSYYPEDERYDIKIYSIAPS